ncbi:hypothetical protein [Deinococcus kurensis]|uniref:hypothetical protein n=1 Tax=Deinococcus kurensis TaxID=2662757 RepID=UPI0012D34ED8|nr:hypothetical protein [Deinococcus kurensis]
MTPPPARVRLDADLKDDAPRYYAFFPHGQNAVVMTDPPGLARFSMQDGVLIGPSPTASFRGLNRNGLPVTPLWVTAQTGLARARKGAEVGEVRFRLPRPARDVHTHVAGAVVGDQGLYEHLNAGAWYQRAGALEVENIRVTLTRGHVTADVRVNGRGALVVLVVPPDDRWNRGVQAIAGAVVPAQRRAHTVTLPIPPGRWRVLAMAGNEYHADVQGDFPLIEQAADEFEPVDLSPVRLGGGVARTTVRLSRPGACVVGFLPRAQALTLHPAHPRFGVQSSEPDAFMALNAAWVGGGAQGEHRAELPMLRGDLSLVAFGAPNVLVADADPYR